MEPQDLHPAPPRPRCAFQALAPAQSAHPKVGNSERGWRQGLGVVRPDCGEHCRRSGGYSVQYSVQGWGSGGPTSVGGGAGSGGRPGHGPPGEQAPSLTLVTRGLLLDHGQRGAGGWLAQGVASAFLDFHLQFGKCGRCLECRRRSIWGGHGSDTPSRARSPQPWDQGPRKGWPGATVVPLGCTEGAGSGEQGRGGSTGQVGAPRDLRGHPPTCTSPALLSSSGPVSSMGAACSFQVGPLWAKCSKACWQDTRPLSHSVLGRGTTYSMGMMGRGFTSGSSPGASGGTTLRGGGGGFSSAGAGPGASAGDSSRGGSLGASSAGNWAGGGGGSWGKRAWWGCRGP